MRAKLALALTLAAVAGTAAYAAPANSASELSPDAQRLVDVARIWVTAEYFHPFLGYKNIDWDAALVNSLPKLRSAGSAAELAAAVNSLLAPLEDNLSVAAETKSFPELPLEEAKPQRVRFHHGLPPDTEKSQIFFSGFMMEDRATHPRVAFFNLSDNVRVSLRLSEAAGGVKNSGRPKQDPLSTAALPSQEGRILSAFRIWGAVRYFFAYKDLMDQDWDALFAEYLPRFISAQDALAYHLTVSELISHLSDSHAGVSSPVLTGYFGEAQPSVRVRLIERKPVIVAADEEARRRGAKIGDVITKVDGENSVDRIQREANFLSASTPASLGDAVARRLLNGGVDSSARLNVSRAGGGDAEYGLPRSLQHEMAERPGSPPVRLLAPGIAYVDLDRLPASAAATIFQKFQSAKAMIFDLRGKCIADPRVLVRAFPEGLGRQSSIVTGPIAMEADIEAPAVQTSTASYFKVMTVPRPPSGGNPIPFLGKVVLLIDERTSGPAEQAALLLVAATHVKVIGNPSAGAPSQATHFTIPGGITVSFSGQDVRLTNGGQLQRQGIQPELSKPLTIAGIRAGRDEVLELARQWLEEESQN